jgi:hypothetical protein
MARLISRDPLSWGQIVFLWLGGSLVIAALVVAGLLCVEQASDRSRTSEWLQARADQHARGQFVLGERSAPFRLTRPYRAPDSLALAAQRLEDQRLADSLVAVAEGEVLLASRSSEAARRYRAGAGLAFLLAALATGLLLVRSFHAAARGSERTRPLWNYDDPPAEWAPDGSLLIRRYIGGGPDPHERVSQFSITGAGGVVVQTWVEGLYGKGVRGATGVVLDETAESRVRAFLEAQRGDPVSRDAENELLALLEG